MAHSGEEVSVGQRNETGDTGGGYRWGIPEGVVSGLGGWGDIHAPLELRLGLGLTRKKLVLGKKKRAGIPAGNTGGGGFMLKGWGGRGGGAHAALERGVLSPIPRAAAAVAHSWEEVSVWEVREEALRRNVD